MKDRTWANRARLLWLCLTGIVLLSGCAKNPVLSGPLPPPKQSAAEAVNPKYQAAISDLESRGANVQILAEESDEPRLMVAFTRTQATDSDLERLRSLRLTSLNLTRSAVGDRGLENLKSMTTLNVLMLDGTQVTDHGLKALEKLTGLKTLTLGEQHISDAGLDHLKNLTNLNSFRLSSDQITDKGLVYFRSLKRLTSLVIGGPKITDAGLENLRDLVALRFLGVASPQITNKGLENLKGLTNLNELVLSGCPNITDAGLEIVEHLPKLRSLYLQDCTGVTDNGLGYLKGIADPETLDLRGTGVTDAGVKQLQKALPALRITR
jgi:Leucine-rich repeat (LRR) protein